MADSLPEPSHSIDLLTRRDENIELNTQKSKRHSALVRKMRLILPILALGVVVILMTWKDDSAPVAAIPRDEVSPQTVTQNELIKPKFQSEDSNNQPYTITADKATQSADNMDTLQLQKPVADMTLKSGGWVSLTATNGTYQQEHKNLLLDGEVTVHHDSGYEIHTEKMNINVGSQQVTSDSPVTGQGPAGDITASGLSVDGNSKTVIFTGPAKLTFHQTAPKEKTKE